MQTLHTNFAALPWEVHDSDFSTIFNNYFA